MKQYRPNEHRGREPWRELATNDETVVMVEADRLVNFLPFPRALLRSELSMNAKLVYAILLSRGTLSQENGWADGEFGQIFVIYPVKELAETYGRSESTVKRALRELEEGGLIERKSSLTTRANRIYLYLPPDTTDQSFDNGYYVDTLPKKGSDPVKRLSEPLESEKKGYLPPKKDPEHEEIPVYEEEKPIYAMDKVRVETETPDYDLPEEPEQEEAPAYLPEQTEEEEPDPYAEEVEEVYNDPAFDKAFRELLRSLDLFREEPDAYELREEDIPPEPDAYQLREEDIPPEPDAYELREEDIPPEPDAYELRPEDIPPEPDPYAYRFTDDDVPPEPEDWGYGYGEEGLPPMPGDEDAPPEPWEWNGVGCGEPLFLGFSADPGMGSYWPGTGADTARRESRYDRPMAQN